MRSNSNSAADVRTVRDVTVAGLFVNLCLLVFKFWAGIIGASSALTADAFHTLTDVSTDLAIILGVKWWMSPPDKCHPYGHQRIEALVTLFVGSVLSCAAIWLGYDAVAGLRDPHDSSPKMIALIAAMVSIVSKEGMYRLTVRTARRINSRALLANAWHHRSDAFSSIPAAAAVGVSIFRPELAFIDHVGEFVVAGIILRASYKILQSALQELSDGGGTPHDRELIETIVKSVEGVKGVHKVRSRRVGPGLHVDLHVLVDGNATVRHGHDISERVQQKLRDDGPDVIDTVAHIEPDDARHRAESSV